MVELPPIEIEGIEQYEVQSIQSHRDKKGGREYLVRWKGYSPAEDTWEPTKHLTGAQREVDKYYQRYLEDISKPVQKRQRKE